MKNLFFATGLLAIFLFSCKKETAQTTYKSSEIWECHQKSQWDSIKIHDKLIGKWSWIYVVKGWGSGENATDGKGLTLDFKTNGTVDVFQNGVFQSTSTWKMHPYLGSGGIETDPIIERTDGGILFCDDELVFSATPYDGNDNFFVRKK